MSQAVLSARTPYLNFIKLFMISPWTYASTVHRIWGIAWSGINIYLVCGNTITCSPQQFMNEPTSLAFHPFNEWTFIGLLWTSWNFMKVHLNFLWTLMNFFKWIIVKLNCRSTGSWTNHFAVMVTTNKHYSYANGYVIIRHHFLRSMWRITVVHKLKQSLKTGIFRHSRK